MAVVIHGSFDEGPVILALPPYFQSALAETDPIFTAWNKSTGITIGRFQITDNSTIVGTEDLSSININTSGTILANNIAGSTSGVNTGDQDLTGYVPYVGATQDVDLGAYDISVASITIDGTPTNPTDGVTKGYVDGIVSTGIAWEEAVLDIVAVLPGGASTGDRYILSTDDTINEWDTDHWDSTAPPAGTTLFVAGDDAAPTNNIGTYTYNGVDWIYVGSSIKHNDTTDKEGGGGGHYYHLSAATSTTVTYITTTGSDAVPTGLTIVDSGLTTADDGTQSAYVVLTWDAISTNTFDHYHVRFKKTSYTYYTYLDSLTNTITIDGLIPNISYDFAVASVNKYGTASAFCANVTDVTLADTTPPATVAIGSATGGIQCILLEWSHNSEADLTSYNVYRNTEDDSGGSILIANTKSNRLTDAPLPVNTEYFYWLKAVDTSGNESVSFSTTVSATTMFVESSDVESISADKILLTGTTYLSSWGSTDSTKIDGAVIDTGTITLNSLNFTTGQAGGGIIAHINGTAEMLQLDADLFEVSGSVVFVSKIGGSYDSSDSDASRVRIFPDSSTGIQITDDDGNDVFKAEIGGINVGDVTIGNWAASQGIKYDKSANTTTFAGVLEASEGHIGSWDIDSDAVFSGTKQITDGYSVDGITLSGDGSIHAENFYINSDGTTNIAGSLPHTVRKKAGTTRHTSASEVSIISPTYLTTGLAKRVTFINGLLGTASFSFELKKHIFAGTNGYGRIYRNSVPLGTQWAAATDSYEFKAQNITQDWLPGDTCELRLQGDSGIQVFVRNFTIGYDDDPIVTVDSTVWSL